MTRGPDAATLLRRAIEASADRAGVTAAIGATGATAWSSATFTGARHELTMTCRTGNAFDRWLGGLAEADLPIRGHIVADVVVVSVARDGEGAQIRLAALTVEA